MKKKLVVWHISSKFSIFSHDAIAIYVSLDGNYLRDRKK